MLFCLRAGCFLFGHEPGHSIARPIALTGNRVPPQRTVLRETSCTREEQRQGLAVILVLHKARLCVWINLLDMI